MQKPIVSEKYTHVFFLNFEEKVKSNVINKSNVEFLAEIYFLSSYRIKLANIKFLLFFYLFHKCIYHPFLFVNIKFE